MIKKNLNLSLLILATILISSCGEQPQQQIQPKSYELEIVKTSEFAYNSRYSASVRGQQDIDIYPQVSGYLTDIKVSEGQEVKKGELLFVIEQAPYKAAYEAAKAGVVQAEAAVATAELNYSNSLNLNNKNIISDSELQTAKNSLESAKAQLAVANAQTLSAKTNLEFTQIKSPSNGVVGTIPYRKGTLVSASLPRSLTVVSDNSNMYVYFSMSENQVYDLFDKYGSLDKAVEGISELDLELSNGSIYQHKGRVESISGILDSATGAVSIRAVFENPERRLISGSSANVVIYELLKDVIVVPKSATIDIQGKYFAYKVVDGKAVRTPIAISKVMNSTEYIVTSGLSNGDVIIASGAGLVVPGSAVAVKE